MTKPITRKDYARRIARVAAYIERHLDDDIPLDRLAEIACFSRFHFHRIYHAVAGETVADTVQRLRLERATGDLAAGTRPIGQVARRAGYGSQAAFTRAFRQRFGVTPGRLRDGSDPTRDRMIAMTEFELRNIDSIRCAAVAHRGPYMAISAAFATLAAWAAAQRLDLTRTRVLALTYDDPNSVPAAELRSHACVAVGPERELGPPVEELVVAGGRYAVFRHVGPYQDLHRTFRAIYERHLPDAGLTPRDAPPFEHYLNDASVVPPEALITDIHIPV